MPFSSFPYGIPSQPQPSSGGASPDDIGVFRFFHLPLEVRSMVYKEYFRGHVADTSRLVDHAYSAELMEVPGPYPVAKDATGRYASLAFLKLRMLHLALGRDYDGDISQYNNIEWKQLQCERCGFVEVRGHAAFHDPLPFFPSPSSCPCSRGWEKDGRYLCLQCRPSALALLYCSKQTWIEARHEFYRVTDFKVSSFADTLCFLRFSQQQDFFHSERDDGCLSYRVHSTERPLFPSPAPDILPHSSLMLDVYYSLESMGLLPEIASRQGLRVISGSINASNNFHGIHPGPLIQNLAISIDLFERDFFLVSTFSILHKSSALRSAFPSLRNLNICFNHDLQNHCPADTAFYLRMCFADSKPEIDQLERHRLERDLGWIARQLDGWDESSSTAGNLALSDRRVSSRKPVVKVSGLASERNCRFLQSYFAAPREQRRPVDTWCDDFLVWGRRAARVLLYLHPLSVQAYKEHYPSSWLQEMIRRGRELE